MKISIALRWGWTGLAVLAATAAPLSSQEPATEAAVAAAPARDLIPTSAFAARTAFTSMPRLSPNGDYIAMTRSNGDHEVMTILRVDGDESVDIPIAAASDVQWYQWAGEDRLLWSAAVDFSIAGIPLRINRMYVHDRAKGSTSELGDVRVGVAADELLYVDPAGGYILLAMQPALDDEPEVWRFPLDGGAGQMVERRRGVWRWFADNEGVVRIGLGADGRRLKVWYRGQPGEEFRVVAKLKPDAKEELWDLARLIAGKDEGFALEPGPSGRVALRRFNYATREAGEVLYENPQWDLDGMLVDEDGTPLAVQFTDDRSRVVWLDPEMEKLQSSLMKALGGVHTTIVDRSLDGSRLLVAKGDASDPGSWYVFARATRQLQEVAQLRPEIDPRQLAPVRPIRYTARDGTEISAYLTLPRDRGVRNLPLIVMPHGGPYGIRDQLEYSDEVQLLANRGYAVLQPNYRGSSGFGEQFEELGQGEIGRRMQDDLDDGVAWATASGVADPRRVCLVGSSYGGYAALWGVIRNPDIYRCAASFAGVTEWDKQLKYDGNFFDRTNRRAWRDRVRGENRKFDLDSVSPAPQAARLTRPILLGHGKRDGNVPFTQFEIMQKALQKARFDQAEYFVLEQSGHSFSSSKDEQAWYDALVTFLAKHNPAD